MTYILSIHAAVMMLSLNHTVGSVCRHWPFLPAGRVHSVSIWLVLILLTVSASLFLSALTTPCTYYWEPSLHGSPFKIKWHLGAVGGGTCAEIPVADADLSLTTPRSLSRCLDVAHCSFCQ